MLLSFTFSTKLAEVVGEGCRFMLCCKKRANCSEKSKLAGKFDLLSVVSGFLVLSGVCDMVDSVAGITGRICLDFGPRVRERLDRVSEESDSEPHLLQHFTGITT